MIHTLNAYLDPESDLYHYDDKPKGVFKEPLVRSTTDAIHDILLSSSQWDDHKTMPPKVTLKFTADTESCLFMQLKKDPIVRLHYRRKDHDMCVYAVQGIFPERFVDEMEFMEEMGDALEVELCEHLFDYFPSAPEIFYCQVKLEH